MKAFWQGWTSAIIGMAVGFLLMAWGCSKAPVTAPETRSASIIGTPSVKAWVTLESGQKVLAWVQLDREHPGMATVLYICDYPVGVYGPPMPGHCFTNGDGCTGAPGAWNPQAYVTHSFILDPDTGDNIQGDGDGTPIHSKIDPDDTGNRVQSNGDPTADD